MAEATPVVGIIMGSESDMPAMEPCMAQLDAMGVPYEVKVASAHRKPAVVHEWAETAHDRGIKVIIAAAGKAVTPGGAVEICRILGKEETIRRLKLGLEKLNG